MGWSDVRIEDRVAEIISFYRTFWILYNIYLKLNVLEVSSKSSLSILVIQPTSHNANF